jgi:hypothetical protein
MLHTEMLRDAHRVAPVLTDFGPIEAQVMRECDECEERVAMVARRRRLFRK